MDHKAELETRDRAIDNETWLMPRYEANFVHLRLSEHDLYQLVVATGGVLGGPDDVPGMSTLHEALRTILAGHDAVEDGDDANGAYAIVPARGVDRFRLRKATSGS